MEQAILDPDFKAPSGVLEARSIRISAEEYHAAMAIEEEEEEKEADEGASNAGATQTGLGVNSMEAASTHDEPIKCCRQTKLSPRESKRQRL